MTTITNDLMNNAVRTSLRVAMNSSSAPAPAWLVWVVIALLVILVGVMVWVIVDTWIW